MLSINGMRPFEGIPNTKTVWAWPKADNIISLWWDVTLKIKKKKKKGLFSFHMLTQEFIKNFPSILCIYYYYHY
jgi:hypothetical protein